MQNKGDPSNSSVGHITVNVLPVLHYILDARKLAVRPNVAVEKNLGQVTKNIVHKRRSPQKKSSGLKNQLSSAGAAAETYNTLLLSATLAKKKYSVSSFTKGDPHREMWDCLQEAACGHCLKVASALLAVILVYLAVKRQRARAREEFLRARWNSFGEVRKLLRTTQNLFYIFHSFVEFLAVNSQKSTVQSCLFAANLLVVCLRKCHYDILKL